MKFVAVFLLVTEASFATVAVQSFDLSYDCAHCKPEQIHIAFGERTNEIVVTWSTAIDTGASVVRFGINATDRKAEGWRTEFVDGRGQWVHRVALKGLRFDAEYVYVCGCEFGWSRQLWFRVPPAGTDFVARAAIFGDMGVQNAKALPYLHDEVHLRKFDAIIHAGDFAYDMHEDDSRRGDKFMRLIEPVAAHVPYMVSPGNHEENRNFSNYRSRFSMPRMRSAESLFHSWALGPLHVAQINTEAYYFLQYGVAPLVNQYEWLKKDLADANEPHNRRRRPWLLVVGHRPMYCSNSDDLDCGAEYTRTGLAGLLGLEPLLARYGVDVAIWAHEHSYERTWPLYDNVVYNGSWEHPYLNPRATVHIVTGSAGCREGRDHFKNKPLSWSAFRSQDFGYTRLKVFNNTHLNIEQVSVDLDGQVIDSFWIVKNESLSFNMHTD